MGKSLSLYKRIKNDNDAGAFVELKELVAKKPSDKIARTYLGLCYSHGYVVSKDENEAIKCFEHAAKLGYDVAKTNLGITWQHGLGVDADLTKAVYWYLESAKQKTTNKGGSQSAISKLIELANDTNPHTDVLCTLALCYNHAYSIVKNNSRAMELYLQAAQLGHPLAMMNVGVMYEKGWAVPIDKVMAAQWYKESAKHSTNSENDNLAISLLEKLSTNNPDHAGIVTLFAECCENGYGMDKNEKKAFGLYHKLVKKGSSIAMYHLGRVYHDGIGQDQNAELASYWYKESAKHLPVSSKQINLSIQRLEDLASVDAPNETVLNNLALCYKLGYGLPQNREKAIEIYRRLIQNLTKTITDGLICGADLPAALNRLATYHHIILKQHIQILKKRLHTDPSMLSLRLLASLQSISKLPRMMQIDVDCLSKLKDTFKNETGPTSDLIHYMEYRKTIDDYAAIVRSALLELSNKIYERSKQKQWTTKLSGRWKTDGTEPGGAFRVNYQIEWMGNTTADVFATYTLAVKTLSEKENDKSVRRHQSTSEFYATSLKSLLALKPDFTQSEYHLSLALRHDLSVPPEPALASTLHSKEVPADNAPAMPLYPSQISYYAPVFPGPYFYPAIQGTSLLQNLPPTPVITAPLIAPEDPLLILMDDSASEDKSSILSPFITLWPKASNQAPSSSEATPVPTRQEIDLPTLSTAKTSLFIRFPAEPTPSKEVDNKKNHKAVKL